VQEAARSSLDELRRVVRRLRPGVLEDLGLLSALTALTVDFTVLTGVTVRRSFDPSPPNLDATVELVIYRITQEGLTNIARHAAAGEVMLTLTGHDRKVILRLEDNGKGLQSSHEGAGIRGMRERAILVGADFSIASRPGGGTELRLVVPVQHDEQ
jgi:two-component system, NarL family, sensor histidine kinase UhpB